jgi:drug/metabolite transporter (DMT)-like permease
MVEALSLRIRTRPWGPYAALGLGIFVLSWGAIFVRIAQAQGVPSLVIAALRYSTAAVLLSPYALSRHRDELRRLSRRDIGLIALAGMLLVTALLATFMALEHTTVLIANVVSNTSPLWVALMEVLILGAVFSRRVWMGLALALGGTLLFALAGIEDLSAMGSNPLLGAGLAFGSALFGASYFVLGRAVRSRVSTAPFMWISLLSGSALALLMVLLSGTALTGYPLEGYFWILVVTITGQLIGQYLLAYCLAHLPATFVSISLQVLVVLSATLAFLVFGERPGLLQILASGVILAGVVITLARREP